MGFGCCWFANQQFTSDCSSFPEPWAGFATRDCCRSPTILRGEHILPSISKLRRQSLIKFFQQNGYFEAQVKPEIQTDAAHGLVNVAFQVKPQSPCQIRQSDSQGCSAGRRTATSAGVEVMDGQGSWIRNPHRETVFAEKNTERHSVSGIAVDQPRLSRKPGTNGGRRV